MKKIIWPSIASLIGNLCISTPLFWAIYNFISLTPILSVNIVDLLYKDTIAYIYAMVFISTLAVIHCLLLIDNTHTVGYVMSMVYSDILVFFLCCRTASLIFSGGLRLVSLIRNSEAGL